MAREVLARIQWGYVEHGICLVSRCAEQVLPSMTSAIDWATDTMDQAVRGEPELAKRFNHITVTYTWCGSIQ